MDNLTGTILMDSSTGTIIYIILMILVFGASALKKKKKRSPAGKARPKEKPGTSAPGGKLTDFLNKLMEEAIPEAKQQPVNQFPDGAFPDDSEIVEDYTEFEEPQPGQLKPEGVSAFSRDDPSTPFVETGIENDMATTSHQMPEEIKQDDLTLTGKNDLTGIISDFSLKKAIIFSEILKPKYFKIHDY